MYVRTHLRTHARTWAAQWVEGAGFLRASALEASSYDPSLYRWWGWQNESSGAFEALLDAKVFNGTVAVPRSGLDAYRTGRTRGGFVERKLMDKRPLFQRIADKARMEKRLAQQQQAADARTEGARAEVGEEGE